MASQLDTLLLQCMETALSSSDCTLLRRFAIFLVVAICLLSFEEVAFQALKGADNCLNVRLPLHNSDLKMPVRSVKVICLSLRERQL